MVVAIGLFFWAQYARTVRASTLVEKNKEYVDAARLIGLAPFWVMVRHVLPNVAGPILVIATINLALAILEEATLSFLGVGMPPTQPSFGTLIRIGQQYLFSGEWWILLFPGVTLVLLSLAINLLGDWLRDALNPRLKWPHPSFPYAISASPSPPAGAIWLRSTGCLSTLPRARCSAWSANRGRASR